MGRERQDIGQQGRLRGGEIEKFEFGFVVLSDLQQGNGPPADAGVGNVAEVAEIKIRFYPAEVGRDTQRASRQQSVEIPLMHGADFQKRGDTVRMPVRERGACGPEAARRHE